MSAVRKPKPEKGGNKITAKSKKLAKLKKMKDLKGKLRKQAQKVGKPIRDKKLKEIGEGERAKRILNKTFKDKNKRNLKGKTTSEKARELKRFAKQKAKMKIAQAKIDASKKAAEIASNIKNSKAGKLVGKGVAKGLNFFKQRRINSLRRDEAKINTKIDNAILRIKKKNVKGVAALRNIKSLNEEDYDVETASADALKRLANNIKNANKKSFPKRLSQLSKHKASKDNTCKKLQEVSGGEQTCEGWTAPPPKKAKKPPKLKF
tara:strand:+ start:2925 stop:3713 length:789 start_codon:yes stop_codon:yes gene_type:complete